MKLLHQNREHVLNYIVLIWLKFIDQFFFFLWVGSGEGEMWECEPQKYHITKDTVTIELSLYFLIKLNTKGPAFQSVWRLYFTIFFPCQRGNQILSMTLYNW